MSSTRSQGVENFRVRGVDDHEPMTALSTAFQAMPRQSSNKWAVLASNDETDLPGVLIYTPHLLSGGQHYVQQHAARLRRHRPVFAGRRRVAGPALEDFPNFTFPTGSIGRLQEYRFLLAGTDPDLLAFIRRYRIQMIHAHFGPGGVEIMPLAKRLGIPLVVTFHGWDVKLSGEARRRLSLYELIYRSRLPRLFRQSSGIICVSEKWQERIVKLGLPT